MRALLQWRFTNRLLRLPLMPAGGARVLVRHVFSIMGLAHQKCVATRILSTASDPSAPPHQAPRSPLRSSALLPARPPPLVHSPSLGPCWPAFTASVLPLLPPLLPSAPTSFSSDQPLLSDPLLADRSRSARSLSLSAPGLSRSLCLLLPGLSRALPPTSPHHGEKLLRIHLVAAPGPVLVHSG